MGLWEGALPINVIQGQKSGAGDNSRLQRLVLVAN